MALISVIGFIAYKAPLAQVRHFIFPTWKKLPEAQVEAHKSGQSAQEEGVVCDVDATGVVVVVAVVVDVVAVDGNVREGSDAARRTEK